MYSCKKDTQLTHIFKNNDEEIIQTIIDFKANVNNPSKIKSDNYLSITDAIWLIESSLNYTYYLKPYNNEFNAIYTDSLSFEISDSDSLILYSEVITLYNSIYNDIENKLNSIYLENKRVGLVDLEYVSNSLKLVIFVDCFSQETKSKTLNCNSLDMYWYWGYYMGSYYPEGCGGDASSVIYKNIEFLVNVEPADREFMINIQGKEFTWYDYQNDINIYYSHHKLFFNIQPFDNNQFEPIIDPINMVKYKNQSLTVFNTLKNNSLYKPTGKKYAGFAEYKWNKTYHHGPNIIARNHYWKLYFGKVVILPPIE